MRHQVAGKKLGRDTEHRTALFRNLAIALFTHEQITTTIPKAKAVQAFVEKLITTAKKGDLTARRRIIKAIGNPILVDRDLKDFDRKDLHADGYKVNKYHELQDGPRVVKKLVDDIAPRYQERDGGYTRIIKLAKFRIGDAAQLCVLQLVGEEEGPQVSGNYSRRRDKANKRMEFAAKLRKGKGKSEQSDKQDEAEADGEIEAAAAEETATAVADEVTETDSTAGTDEAPATDDAASSDDAGDESDDTKAE